MKIACPLRAGLLVAWPRNARPGMIRWGSGLHRYWKIYARHWWRLIVNLRLNTMPHYCIRLMKLEFDL